MSDLYNNAFNDFLASIKKYRLWLYLGKSDIKLRYRGSVLGPVWITFSMLITISALSLVYSRLLHQNIREYIPFLTCGILIWSFIASTLGESTEVFVSSKDFIDSIRMPYFIFLYRMIWRNILIFLHNLVVYFLVVIIFSVKIDFYTLLAIPGFILVALNLSALSMILALVGTRFRDLPPIVTALITVTFFVSPITWQPHLLGNSRIITYNPVYHFLDLVRSPLLGQAPQLESVIFCLTMTIVCFLLAFFLFERNSKKIPMWI